MKTSRKNFVAALCAVALLALVSSANAESPILKVQRYFFGQFSVTNVRDCQPDEDPAEDPVPVEEVSSENEAVTPSEEVTSPHEEVDPSDNEAPLPITEEEPPQASEEAYEDLSNDVEAVKKRFQKTFFPLELTSDRDVYRYVNDDVCDTVTLKVKSGRSAYLYVWSLNPEGEFRLVYPSKFNKDSSQYQAIEADKELVIPGPDSEYEFAVAPPFGDEMLIAITRVRPFDPQNEDDQKALAPFLSECKQDLLGVKAIQNFHKSVVDRVKKSPTEFGFSAIHIKTVKVETLSE